jgi:hypothetical protein
MSDKERANSSGVNTFLILFFKLNRIGKVIQRRAQQLVLYNENNYEETL